MDDQLTKQMKSLIIFSIYEKYSNISQFLKISTFWIYFAHAFHSYKITTVTELNNLGSRLASCSTLNVILWLKIQK